MIKIKQTPIENKNQNQYPKISLKSEDSTLEFNLDMHVMNPFDNSIDAIVFSCHLKANLNFRVGDDLSLYMHADDLDANIV